MMQITQQRIKLLAADLISGAFGFLIFDILRFYTLPQKLRPNDIISFLCDKSVVCEQLLVPFVMAFFFAICGSYNKINTLYKSRLDESLISIVVSMLTMLVVFFVALINDSIPERATNYELMCALFFSLLIPVWSLRMIVLTANSRRVQRGDYVIDTMVVGVSPENRTRFEKLQHSSARLGLKFTTLADIDNCLTGDSYAGYPIIHGEDASSLARNCGADAVVILPSSKGLKRTADIIESLYSLDKPLFVSPDLHGLMGMRPRISSIAAEPVIDITNSRVSPMASNLKRIGDVLSSLFALLILSPVFAILAIAIKVDSNGPVLYKQTRIGRHKKPFKILKFRTMHTNAEKKGPALAQEDDPRVTRVGHFLRKYRLDELPQFWNVLIGEMSLVGPRPERDFYIKQIIQRRPAYTLVHQVRPGITSWGMVKYGYASNVDQMLERLDYDLLYLENISLGVDLKILFYTISTVVTGKGL